MSNKILILGATSFGGSSFMKFLKYNSKFKVWGTYKTKKNITRLFKKEKNKFKFIKLDLSIKNNSLTNIVRKIKPKYVFDFASICLVNESWVNPEYYLKVNFSSKLKFIKNIDNFQFLDKYIYISTPEIFGSRKNFILETEKRFNPSTPYALSKLCMEQLITTYPNVMKKSVIVRASNFYGIDQLNHRLIPKLIYFIKNKKKFPLHGNGMSKRNFLFEDDFNIGLLKILKYGKKGGIYHFSSKEYYTIRKIVKMACNIMNVSFEDYVYKANDRVGKDKYYFLDTMKTQKQLKWKSKVSIKEGLQKLIENKIK